MNETKTIDLKAYFFTFGQLYRIERHPQGGHPDGWFRVLAINQTDARYLMNQLCGAFWCACYTADEFGASQRALYPLGELACFIDKGQFRYKDLNQSFMQDRDNQNPNETPTITPTP